MAAPREIIASAVAPLSWISTPLGILPVAFDGRCFSTSNRLKIYCYSVTILLAAVELYHFMNVIFLKTRAAMSGDNILVVVSYLIGNSICVLNIMYVVKRRKTLVKILNQLDKIASALSRSVEVKNLLRQVYMFVFFLQLLTTIVYFYLKLEEFHFERGFSLDSILHWTFITCRICGKTTLMCTGAHFCVLCIIVRSLIRATNKELRLWIEDCNSHTVKSEKKLPGRLIKLRIHHANLYFVAEEVISMYGVFVLLNLVYVNIFFQTGAFNIISKAYKALQVENIKWNNTLSYNLYWIFVDAIKANVFFYAAILLTKEAWISYIFIKILHFNINILIKTNEAKSKFFPILFRMSARGGS